MKGCLSVVVAGEVDSGKSTLIGRILYEMGLVSCGVIKEIEDTSQRLGGDFEFAYLLDSFEEERRKKMTIDSTQAFCKAKNRRDFIFIDVPGHRELIKNMLCGSSYADAAIIVVDVQRSIEQQTKRHAFILQFLGVEQIILVINKMDLVNYSEGVFERVKKSAIASFKKIGLRTGYFIPVSAKGGENLLNKSKNMAWYEGAAIIETLNAFLKRGTTGDLRFPIQDVYNTGDGKKIAVGQIISGKIRKGQRVNILPLKKDCRVKEIRDIKKNKPAARWPQSIGLILDDMNGLSRGQVICKSRLPRATTRILSKIFCAQSLNIKETFRLQCATQQASAQIKKVNRVWDTASLKLKAKGGSLEETDIAEVAIITEIPMVTEEYHGLNSLGRFILWNDLNEICAAGVIL